MVHFDSAIVDSIVGKTSASREALSSTLALALEISRESGEGHRVGALLTVGNADRVLALSRPLILDPLRGHVPEATHISDPRLRGTIKELAQLDGAFIVADDGTVVAACRYLDAAVENIASAARAGESSSGGRRYFEGAGSCCDCRFAERRGAGVL